jgi:hypothetical protein
MRKAAISLGLALALGVLQNYGLGQTPAQNLETTAQSPSTSTVAGNPTNTQPDKPAKNQDRKWHVKLGPVLVGTGYSRFGGPSYYPYGFSPFDGFYRAWLWDPYWAYPLSYPPGYFGYNDGRGEVRLTLEPKSVDPKLAEVYVDNAFAGTADHLKNIWLEPGAYELSVLSKDGTAFRRRIYVLSGRSLKIAAKLDPVTPGDPKESKP